MVRNGAGARIAWSIKSKQVKNALSDVLRGHPLELLEFEEGESRREAAFEAYAAARVAGAVTIQRFLDFPTFAEAVRHQLAQGAAKKRCDIFLQDSERKGVYRSTAEAVGEFARDLLSYDGNSVLIVTENADHGVLLDLEEGTHGPAIIELESW